MVETRGEKTPVARDLSSTPQEPGDGQAGADHGQKDRPGVPSMARVAVALYAVDRDRLELHVRQGRAAEPSHDLDRLTREFAGPEESEEPLPDPQGLAVVEEQDARPVAHHEVLGPDQARD